MMDLEATQDDYFNMPGASPTGKGGMVIGSDDLAERGDHWRGLAMQERKALEKLARLHSRDGESIVELLAWARSEA